MTQPKVQKEWYADVPRSTKGPTFYGFAAIVFAPPLAMLWQADLVPLVLAGTVLHPGQPASRVLEAAPLRWIGRISYSLYLWQQLFLAPAWRHGDLGWPERVPASIAAVFACVLRMLWRLRTANQKWRSYPAFLIEENRWRAQRYGVSDRLFDFGKGKLVPFAALIDELPLVGVLMAAADGTSELRDASELRVKESDRIAATVAGLRAIGASVEELPDGWRVTRGTPREARVATHGDHRIAIAFAVAALAGVASAVELDDPECVAVSYPAFWDDLAEVVA